MPKSEPLGFIDCPACGGEKTLRITHDKNGQPFGFCEAVCNLQLRVGGDARRVRLFVERYPFAGPAPVTVTAPKPEVVGEAEPVPEAVAEKPETKKSAFADVVALLGGRG